MVLTNFECWAHGGGGATGGDCEHLGSARRIDLFNSRDVHQRGLVPVSHISSNGYYGFSYVNAAHENHNNNSNNHINMNMANDVNNMNMAVSNADVNVEAGVARCKKRFYVSSDGCNGGVDDVATNYPKRCRYDDDVDFAAQYCNDFYSLVSTQQIGTQSCLMDTEDFNNSPALALPNQQDHQPQTAFNAISTQTMF